MLEQRPALRRLHWAFAALITAATLALLGPIVLDVDPNLPLSLQSLLVCWLPLMFGWRAGVTGVLTYVALGCCGVPVFAGYRGGMEILAGPTGGYLLGMPVAALVLGSIGSATPEKINDRQRYIRIALGMVIGHIVILAFGIPWQGKFDPGLDVVGLLDRLYPPALLKSALGVLLSVIAIRATGPRA